MKKVTPINITRLTKEYGPGYIAKDKKSGRVVAFAHRVDLLLKQVNKNKEEVVISWVPKHGARYVFRLSLCVR